MKLPSRVSAGLVPSAAWGSHLWMCLWVLWAPPDMRLPMNMNVISREDPAPPPGRSWAQGRSSEAGAVPWGVTPSCLQLQAPDLAGRVTVSEK